VYAKEAFLFAEFDFLGLFVEEEFACFDFELHINIINLNRKYRYKNILKHASMSCANHADSTHSVEVLTWGTVLTGVCD
jgi:hypothetical protein